RRSLLLSMLFILLLYYIVTFLTCSYTSSIIESSFMLSQVVQFYIIWVLGLAFYAITQLASSSNTSKTVNYLSVPIHSMERFAVAILYSLFVWSLVNGIAFYLAMKLYLFTIQPYFMHDGSYALFETLYYLFPLFVSFCFSIHVKYLLGSVVFKNNHFLKTTAVLLGMVGLIVLIIHVIAWGTASNFDQVTRNFFKFYTFNVFKVPSTYSYTTTMLYPVISLWIVVYNLGLYIPIYYKIKEKEAR
ncbi:hypothetical protein OAT16_03525, partial [Prolixibacteraceae bacterium]|nr:hypothetical protein [Prolixibacteraceae bacterium]